MCVSGPYTRTEEAFQTDQILDEQAFHRLLGRTSEAQPTPGADPSSHTRDVNLGCQ